MRYVKIKQMIAKKKIVVGLGNPGPDYENTYHNVGAMAVTSIAGESVWKVYKKIFAFATVDGSAFVIPLTFMNESGLAVKEALKKFSAGTKDLIVIHDESDLPLGSYKISVGKSSAGHRGIQSIMDTIRSKDFARIRIGVRDPAEKKRKKAGDFILKKISQKNERVLEDVFASLKNLS